MNRLVRILILITSLLLAGCTPFIRIEQPIIEDVVRLENGKTIGQTFTASYNGLSGIAVYLKPESELSGDLILKLSPIIPKDAPALREANLNGAIIEKPGYYRFNFSPIQHSTAQDYYLQINFEGQGELFVGTGTPDSYLNGALYLNRDAVDSQLAFRLAYDRIQTFLGLGREALNWLGLLTAAIFLFVLPGWGILTWLLPNWDKTWWPVKIGLSAGLSLAIYPILFLWTDLFGLHLGQFYAWLVPIAGLALVLWHYRRSPMQRPRISNQVGQIIPNIVFLGLVALLVLTRLWGIRMLIVPMWGDSLQHTMITQLLIDHRGLFDSWQPYSPLTSFTYHFGFHTLAATFHWITGLTSEQATLWAGQMINILAVIAVIPWAVRLGGSRWAGIGALLVAGLLAPMPQSYVNWGRYTQLAGQTILPAAAYIGWSLFSENQKNRWGILLTGVMMAGLALTHYRVIIFGGLFFIAVLLLEFDLRKALTHAKRVVQAGLLAGVIFLPWFLHAFAGSLLAIFSAMLSTPASQLAKVTLESNAIGNLFAYLPPGIWLLLPVIAAWGIWRRDRGVAAICLWWFLCLLAANPGWLNLPGTGIIGSFSVLIALYIPAAILFGAALGWLAGQNYRINGQLGFSSENTWFFAILLGLLTLALGFLGAKNRINDFKPMESVLFTRPDERAADWIKQNTPKDAVFLVNSFYVPHWSLVVGSDGGWWLPLEAERQTTLPPINYSSEDGPRPDFIEWVNQLTLKLVDSNFDDPVVRELLMEHGVTYIYIGQRQGMVNNPGPVIEVAQLLNNPDFVPVYHQDRVWIFRVLPNG